MFCRFHKQDSRQSLYIYFHAGLSLVPSERLELPTRGSVDHCSNSTELRGYFNTKLTRQLLKLLKILSIFLNNTFLKRNLLYPLLVYQKRFGSTFFKQLKIYVHILSYTLVYMSIHNLNITIGIIMWTNT